MLINLVTGMTEQAPPLDVILVPGVCFDSQFQRVRSHDRQMSLLLNRLVIQLGHGKGYYDRYIERYRAFASQRGGKPPLLGTLDTIGISSHADFLLLQSLSP